MGIHVQNVTINKLRKSGPIFGQTNTKRSYDIDAVPILAYELDKND